MLPHRRFFHNECPVLCLHGEGIGGCKGRGGLGVEEQRRVLWGPLKLTRVGLMVQASVALE